MTGPMRKYPADGMRALVRQTTHRRGLAGEGQLESLARREQETPASGFDIPSEVPNSF